MRSAERDLSQLNARQSLALAFFNPRVAMGNDLLPEDIFLTDKYVHKLTNKHTNFHSRANIDRDVLAEVHEWHCPRVVELKFRGLLIEDGWGSHLDHVKVPLVVTTLLLSVVGAWFIFDNWGVAWTVGCFNVALVGLWKRRTDNATQHY